MPPDSPLLPGSVRRKVAWRIVPLIFVLYVISYLDRANAGFAKLKMQSALGWSDDAFGLGFGLFFIGYVFLEIPGALIVEHWSARKWFTRILITWGLCSMAMAFVRQPWQFYLARFMLGLAEAGFFPGVIVYFTHWFPRDLRARAFSGLVFGVPISLALGSRVSGILLEQNWFDIPGWQWVFLIEGAPAVLMGLALPFLLTDRPRQARWLTAAERDWLEDTLARERQAAAGGLSWRQALRHPAVWLLALGIMAANTGGYAMTFWMPSFVNNMLYAPVAEAGMLGLIGAPLGGGPVLGASAMIASSATATSTAALNYIGFIYMCGIAGVWCSGQSSDRTGERKWHCVTGQVLTGTFLILSLIPGQSASMVFAWFCCMGFFAFFWPSPFWVLPTLTLSSSAAAVAIGFINICANLAGSLGPPLVGFLRSAKLPDRSCMLILACFYIAGGLCVAALSLKAPKRENHE